MSAKFASFVSAIKDKGIAKQYYYCHVYPPPAFDVDMEVMASIPFYMVGVNLPEFALLTVPVKDNGLTREVVVDKTYGTVSMTMFSDQAMTIKHFFDNWSHSIVSNKGGLFKYPADYTAPMMQLMQLDTQKNDSYIVSLSNVYPKAVSEVSMSSDAAGPLAFSVSWAYESWETMKLESPMEPLSYDDTINRSLAYIDSTMQRSKTLADNYTSLAQSILRG